MKRNLLTNKQNQANMVLSLKDIITKKVNAQELTWEEAEHFLQGATKGTVKDAQLGAFLMACHMSSLSGTEVGHMTRAMAASGDVCEWPEAWAATTASLQSFGSTGNKAKLILAPAMAACGLKFPIMSSRGIDVVGGILAKLSTIPGFNGTNKSTDDIRDLLEKVGCCVVQQPQQMAPAERIIRDTASMTTTGKNTQIRAACLLCRVAAMGLRSVVLEIPYGPGEYIKGEEEASSTADYLGELSVSMSLRLNIVTTFVDRTVGQMIGQSLEVAEAVLCLNGEGPTEIHELVGILGGHILHAAGKTDDPQVGRAMVAKVIKDGAAKKKFGEMLQAQGVDKVDVKSLLKHRKDTNAIMTSSYVLPYAQYFTHLSALDSGYVQQIDMMVCNELMAELVAARNPDRNDASSGGIQLLSKVGAQIKKGDLWAKIHHNTRLTEYQAIRIRDGIIIGPDPPQLKGSLHVTIASQGWTDTDSDSITTGSESNSSLQLSDGVEQVKKSSLEKLLSKLSPRGNSPKGSPKGSPKDSPKLSPKESPKLSPKESPKTSPKESPKTSSKRSPKMSPKETPKTSPKESPKMSPKESPNVSPKESPCATPTNGEVSTNGRASPSTASTNGQPPDKAEQRQTTNGKSEDNAKELDKVSSSTESIELKSILKNKGKSNEDVRL